MTFRVPTNRSHPATAPDRRERIATMILFVAALGFSFWGVSVGWKSLNLPGCEFRQAQTAVSAFFIQKEHNFSLAYPTPVLGKPWSIPMEFPLYQWTVVGLSNSTGLSLTESGRAVSAASFYLSLPAFYLLLGYLGLARSRRLLVLGLTLTCPLYVFYARSFLIETMALMFGAWFLLAYVRGVAGRSRPWIVLASITGGGCGLVKVTTFMVFLMPAFLWTLSWFWHDFKQPVEIRWGKLARRLLWCASAVIVPFVFTVWWVSYSDAIKSASVAGAFLQSSRLASYNFGYGVRFSPDIWRQHWHVLFHDLTSVPALIGCGLLALFFARHWWRVIGVLVSLFFIVQLIFPILYAWHEYYYVANAFALMSAFGLALCGLFESRLPRWSVWLLALVVYGMQIWSYLAYIYPGQKPISPGGSDLTVALQRVTAPDDVVVIAGNDWSSITPYFAQRRALMIRRNLENSWDELIIPAFEQLKGEDVTALVLHGDQVNNGRLIKLAQEYFHIDPRPVFQSQDATVYLHEQNWAEGREWVRNVHNIHVLETKSDDADSQLRCEISVEHMLKRRRSLFAQMKPTPFKYYTTFGLGQSENDGHRFVGAHPDTRVWFRLPAGPHHLTADIMLLKEAYAENLLVDDRSDGVEIRLEEEALDGSRKVLFSRWLNPQNNPADRGVVTIEKTFTLAHDGVVILSVGPGPRNRYSRDWASLGRVEFE